MKQKEAWRSIPYLIHRIAVRIEESMNKKAKKYGLRLPEMRVLMRLLNGGDMRVGDLAQQTSIEASALSHILKRLSNNGWVTRTRSPEDNRTVLVSLTPKGRELVTMLRPYIRNYNDRAVRGVPATEVAVLRKVLDEIYENLADLDASMPEFPDFATVRPKAQSKLQRGSLRSMRS
jgi:DNA-binding MarR family transcriptional regulator